MTFFCVVCAKYVTRRLGCGWGIGKGKCCFHYIWLMTVMAQLACVRVCVRVSPMAEAAPRGRQLVQDYMLCTAPPLSFMALPFGGCGCQQQQQQQ